MNGDAGKQLKRIIIDLDANDPDVGEAAVRGVMEDGSTVTFHQATRQQERRSSRLARTLPSSWTRRRSPSCTRIPAAWLIHERVVNAG